MMSKDSFFQQAFWNSITNSLLSQLSIDDLQIFILTSNKSEVHLAQYDGNLIFMNQCKPSKYVELIQTTISLDENGLTLTNTFGSLNVSGTQLQQFYESINKYCIHCNINTFYVIQDVMYDLKDFQIYKANDKKSQAQKSIKKYNKLIGHETLKQMAKQIQNEYVFEDEQYIYLIVPFLEGTFLANCILTFEEYAFALLKLLKKYHSQNYAISEFNINNIILQDENLNLELLDTQNLIKMNLDSQQTIQRDLDGIRSLLATKFTDQILKLKQILPEKFSICSVQELLFSEQFVEYFGEASFYNLLNAPPYKKKQIHQFSTLSFGRNNQSSLLETFNTIRSCLLNSSDEEDDDNNIMEDNEFQMQKFMNFSSQQFDDSPILSPKLQQTRHKSKLSSRQFVLETLLSEHIINKQQFEQFFQDKEFENEEEINQFSEMLSKEIENSSLTTPIQSDSNTTCPNTTIIHSKKSVVNRIYDIIHEVQEAQEQQQQDQSSPRSQPYNQNKVQNVRKNLFNMH